MMTVRIVQYVKTVMVASSVPVLMATCLTIIKDAMVIHLYL